MYDLNNLAPQDKDQLLTELLKRYDQDVRSPSTEAVGAPADHGDAQQDQDMLAPVLKVLDIVIEKLEELEQRLEANEKLVVDDLFGGIDKMYKQNVRTQSIDGIKGKYGDMFAPHMDALKELAPDEDIFETLHDMLDPLRGSDGWDDEKEFGAVKGAADSIAQKIAKIKGGDKPAEESAPDGVAVEITKTSAGPIEGGEESDFLKKVRDMKKKATAKGL
jgi:hypothetical protein